jgi:hypothetical protein
MAWLEAEDASISTGWIRLARWLQPLMIARLPTRDAHAHTPTSLAKEAPRKRPDQDGPAMQRIEAPCMFDPN